MSSTQENIVIQPEVEKTTLSVAETTTTFETAVVPPVSVSGEDTETSAVVGSVEKGLAANESLEATPAPSVTVVLSAPKTTEELIAARALKRVARKTAVREKAEGHKRAVSSCSQYTSYRLKACAQGDILFESKNYKASYQQYLEAIQLWGSNPGYFIALAGAYRKLAW